MALPISCSVIPCLDSACAWAATNEQFMYRWSLIPHSHIEFRHGAAGKTLRRSGHRSAISWLERP